MPVFPAILIAVPTLILQSERVLLSVVPSERVDYLLMSQITSAPPGAEWAQWQTYSLNVQLHQEDGACTLRVLGRPATIRLVRVSPTVCEISELLRAEMDGLSPREDLGAASVDRAASRIVNVQNYRDRVEADVTQE